MHISFFTTSAALFDKYWVVSRDGNFKLYKQKNMYKENLYFFFIMNFYIFVFGSKGGTEYRNILKLDGKIHTCIEYEVHVHSFLIGIL